MSTTAATTGKHAHRSPVIGRHPAVPWLLAAAVYLMVALWATWDVWRGGMASTLPACPGNCRADPALSVWFLSYLPHAVASGHDPFFTTWLDHPLGINLMDNTSTFLLDLFGAPVTLIWGPVAAENVLRMLAIAGSGLAAFAAFRRWVNWLPAALVAGLFYEVSPYVVAQGRGHLDLMLAALPPLLLCLGDAVRRGQVRVIPAGLAVGSLLAAQFFVAPELLASTAVMSVLALVLLVAARRRRLLVGFRRDWVKVAALAGGVFACVCGFPVWVMLAGPGHLAGPVQPVSAVAPIASDLLGPLVPGANQLLPTLWAPAHPLSLSAFPDENGAYLGPVLVGFVVVTLLLLRRVPWVGFAGAMAGLAFLFSLGGRLSVAGHTTSVPLPFTLLTHLPLLDSSVAARYSIFVDLFCGVLLAVGLDHLRTRLRRKSHVLAGTATLCVSAAVLVFLLPAWPYPAAPVQTPTFFRTLAAASIPPGGVVLTYPYPRWPTVQPMVWQAMDGMRYAIVGGYAFARLPDGSASLDGPGSFTEATLVACQEGAPWSAPTRAEAAHVAADLRAFAVTTVVISADAPQPQCALSLFSVVFGHPPVPVADVWVWANVPVSLAHSPAASRSAG
jgi:hypothetical protein